VAKRKVQSDSTVKIRDRETAFRQGIKVALWDEVVECAENKGSLESLPPWAARGLVEFASSLKFLRSRKSGKGGDSYGLDYRRQKDLNSDLEIVVMVNLYLEGYYQPRRGAARKLTLNRAAKKLAKERGLKDESIRTIIKAYRRGIKKAKKGVYISPLLLRASPTDPYFVNMLAQFKTMPFARLFRAYLKMKYQSNPPQK
jgi:hypothetical protein